MKKVFIFVVCLFVSIFLGFSQKSEWKPMYKDSKREIFYKIEKNIFFLKIDKADFDVQKDKQMNINLLDYGYVNLRYIETIKQDDYTIIKFQIENRSIILKDKIDYILIHPTKGSLINIMIDSIANVEIHKDLK